MDDLENNLKNKDEPWNEEDNHKNEATLKRKVTSKWKTSSKMNINLEMKKISKKKLNQKMHSHGLHLFYPSHWKEFIGQKVKLVLCSSNKLN